MPVGEDHLRKALRRAAGAIQGMYVGSGHKGINGEAIVALATADAVDGQTWGDATEKARQQLADDWPNSL